MKKTLLLLFLLFLVAIPPVSAKELEDFYFEVGEGNLHDVIHKFGVNPAVGTSYEDVWSIGGTYVFPAVATVMNVTSADTDDDIGGTGAWNITILGLDADYLEINETIQLNGTTPVITSNSYLRVWRAYVTNAGSQGTNDGAIYIGTGAYTGAVPANVYLHILDEHAQTTTTIYTVPVNKTAFMTEIYFTSSEDKTVEYELMWREFGTVFRVKDEIYTYRSVIQIYYLIPREIPQRSDIKVRGQVGATTGEIGVGYNLILVDNDDIGLASEDETQDQTVLFAVILGVVVIALFLLVWGKNK